MSSDFIAFLCSNSFSRKMSLFFWAQKQGLCIPRSCFSQKKWLTKKSLSSKGVVENELKKGGIWYFYSVWFNIEFLRIAIIGAQSCDELTLSVICFCVYTPSNSFLNGTWDHFYALNLLFLSRVVYNKENVFYWVVIIDHRLFFVGAQALQNLFMVFWPEYW